MGLDYKDANKDSKNSAHYHKADSESANPGLILIVTSDSYVPARHYTSIVFMIPLC